MHQAEISICIPAYNTNEYFLRNAIEHILEQSFDNFELIIINDGSNNAVKDIIFSYKDQRIRYFETATPFGGPAKARNIALGKAEGKYIFFHDHDDHIPAKNALEKMYEEMEMNDLDILIFKTLSKDKENEYLSEYIDTLTSENIFDYHNKKLLAALFNTELNALWNKLFKTEFLKTNNLYFNEKLKRPDDVEIFFRYIFIAKRIKAIDNIFYQYRGNPESLISAEYWDQRDLIFINMIRSTLKKNNIYEKIRLAFFEGQINYLKRFSEHIKPEDVPYFQKMLRQSMKLDKISDDDIFKLSENSMNFLLIHL